MTQRMESYNKGLAREMKSCSHTLAILFEYAWSKARRSLEAGKSMARVWLEGSELRSFRYATCLLLLMVVGVEGVRGQDTDYSGTYFIVSGRPDQYNENTPVNNFYLCPTEGWYFYDGTNSYTVTDNGKPFLTTYNCLDGSYDASNAVWIIEKHQTETGCYYIKQKKTTTNGKYRYLVSNGQISGSSSARRMRVHLEEVADANALNTLGDKALFEITFHGETKDLPADHLDIIPHSSDGRNGNDEKYLVVNFKNFNNRQASSDKADGPNGTYGRGTGGIIGVYSNEINEMWHLEVPRPVISFDANNNVKITDPTGFASAIYYTTDSFDPTTNSTPYTAAFHPDVNVTTIKAIAVVDGKVSDVTTFSPPFFLGSEHKYIIQSKYCEFYRLIPNLSVDANTKNVSTLNVPSSTMAWHFEYAEEGYYYIADVNGWYMYYTTTNNQNKYIYLKSSKDDSDGFKFKIASHANGGFNIIPKGSEKAIYKNIFGNNNAGLKPVMYDGTIANDVARWDIIPYSAANLLQWDDQPFTESTNNDTKYYNIVSVSQPTCPLILNNDGLIKSETIPLTGYDDRKAMWVIKNVDSDADGLLDFYTFQNAYTGDFLYYNGAGKEIKKDTGLGVLQMGKPTSEGALDSWSYFAVVQTENGYNIIPSVLVDKTKAIGTGANHEGFNCINRANGHDVTGTWYDNDGGSRWTFVEQTDVKCMNPVFTEEANGDITITTVTNAAKIRYTIDDVNVPTASSTEYTTKSNTSTQKVIKAIAIMGNDASTASNVVTLLNKPTVSLEAESFTYKAAAWEPEATVSLNGVSHTLSDTYPRTYVNNVNVGTATISFTNSNDDTWYVWNVPDKTFSITKKGLTVTANPKTIGYGDDPDNAGVTYSGFVGNPIETESVLGGSLTYTYTTQGENPQPYTPYHSERGKIASYDITPSGLTSTNYNITFEKGTLTVTQKSIGDGSIATGFSYVIESDNSITLKDGETTLIPDPDDTDADVKDYFVASGSEPTSSGKYTTRTVSGRGNYTGSFNIRNAIVHLKNDNNGGTEYSATFVAESAGATDIGHALPEGISAYIITDITGNWAIPEQLDYIPAGVPVLLLANEEINGFEVKDAVLSDDVAEVTETQIGDNMLEEVTEATTGYVNNDQSENYQKAYFDTKQIYLLYNNEFVWNKAGYLAKWKVYLNPNHATPTPDPDPDPDPDPSPAPSRLKIAWHWTSDISNIPTSAIEGRSQWYTIDGRRLSGRPTAKGLYIVEGKKVMIK